MKNKLQLLFGSLLFLWFMYLFIMPRSNAKYNSLVSSNAKGSIAFYVIETGYQNNSFSLDKISPRDETYEYTFSISNYNKDKHLETNAKYNIVIRTTTNLDLRYALYENGNEGDILINKEIRQDDDGTYFNIMSTDFEYFDYINNIDNNYTLSVVFPIDYIGYDYQDILENVEIIVKSEQVTE